MLSWLKIFQMASKETNSKEITLVKQTSGEGLILGLRWESIQNPAASCPGLGVPPPPTLGALKASWM